MLYHLELADARARVKATNAALAAAPDPGAVSIPPFVLGVKVPVVLQQAQAVEVSGVLRQKLRSPPPEQSILQTGRWCSSWASC